MAQGAIVNENAEVAHLQPRYRVTPVAFAAVQDMLHARLEEGGEAAVTTMRSQAERHAAGAVNARKKQRKAKTRQAERRADKPVRTAIKSERKAKAGKRRNAAKGKGRR